MPDRHLNSTRVLHYTDEIFEQFRYLLLLVSFLFFFKINEQRVHETLIFPFLEGDEALFLSRLAITVLCNRVSLYASAPVFPHSAFIVTC